MKKHISFLALALLIPLAFTHAQPVPPALTGSGYRNVQNFFGEYRESGVLSTPKPGDSESREELTVEVTYDQPNIYHLKFLSPSRFAGSVAAYDGESLRLYHPKQNFAASYRNLPANTIGAKQLFQAAAPNFSLKLAGDGGTVAKLPVKTVEYVRTKGAKVKGLWKVHEPMSFPLRTEWDRAGISFVREFTKITFNRPASSKVEFGQGQSRAVIAIPKETVHSEWDFGSGSLSPNEAQKAQRDFGLPTSFPYGLKALKTVRQKGPFPAFASALSNGSELVILVFHPDVGPVPKPEGWGIGLSSGRHAGDYTPYYILNSYTFVAGGNRYFLIGTLPIDDLFVIANTIPAAARPAGR